LPCFAADDTGAFQLLPFWYSFIGYLSIYRFVFERCLGLKVLVNKHYISRNPLVEFFYRNTIIILKLSYDSVLFKNLLKVIKGLLGK